MMVTAMRDPTLIPDEPPAELRYRRRVGLFTSLAALWRSRDLVRTLAERDIRARYKQAVLGFAWALVNPLVLVFAFSILFDRVTKLATGHIPYPVFAYVGLLAWNFFQSAMSTSTNSLITNLSLLNKMQCPREVFPLAALVGSLIDALIAVLILPLMLLAFGYAPKSTSPLALLALPALLLFTTGAGLFVSSVVVYLRDLRYGVPILLQLGLFATPIAYGVRNLPLAWRPVMLLGNPLATVIETFRDTILVGRAPSWGYLAGATLVSAAVFAVAYLLFKRLETGIADVG